MERGTEIYIVLRKSMKKVVRIIIDLLAVGAAFVLGIVGFIFFAFGYWAQTIHWTAVVICLICMALCWGVAGWIVNRLGKKRDNTGE